jgi:hypothetical protein
MGNEYKFKPVAGWDDTTSWLTLLFLLIYFGCAAYWAFAY